MLATDRRTPAGAARHGSAHGAPRTARRAAGRLVTAAVLALLPALAATGWPAPASAVGGSVTAPDAGRIVTGPGPVAVVAVVEGPTAPVELRLVGPTDEGDGTVVARLDDPAGGELRSAFDPACPPGTIDCVDAVPAANGTWTVVLTGGATDRRAFVLEVAPEFPRDITTEPSGDGVVLVSWAANREPDLVAYAVGTAGGTVLADPVDPRAACDAGRCGTAVEPPPGEALTVTAVRTVCPGCSGTLRSTASAPTVAGPEEGPPSPATRSPAPPRPEVAGTPAPGDGTGGGSGAALPGGFGGVSVGPDLIAAPDVPAPLVAPPGAPRALAPEPDTRVTGADTSDSTAGDGSEKALLSLPTPLQAARGRVGEPTTSTLAPLAAALLLAVAAAHTVVAVPGDPRPAGRRLTGAGPVTATPPVAVRRPVDGRPAGRRPPGARRVPPAPPVHLPRPAGRTPPVLTAGAPRLPEHRAAGPAEHLLAPPPLSRRLRRLVDFRRPARPGRGARRSAGRPD